MNGHDPISAARLAGALPLEDNLIDHAASARAAKLVGAEDGNAVEVKIAWGDAVVHVGVIARDASFYIGDADGTKSAVDFAMPADAIGGGRVALVRDGMVQMLPGATVTKTERGTKQTVGALTFEVAVVKQESRVRGGSRLAALMSGAVPHVFGAALACAGFLGAVAGFTPDLNATNDDEISDDQRYLMQHYLAQPAEREQDATDGKNDGAASAAGGQGQRADATEGKLGKDTAPATGARWGKQGNAPRVQLSNAELMHEAATFGAIGLLMGGSDDEGATVPWANAMAAAGNDPQNGNGGLWGDRIGDDNGWGLGLTGIGEGGGCNGMPCCGAGLGLGPIGTYGHGGGGGLDQGFGHGPGGRFKKGHESTGPRLAMSAPSSSGRIPPEVIQRIIRSNYGRFRACYENGLHSNPNLRGAVSVQFIIGRDGAVSNAGGGGDLPDAGVVSCVTRGFGALQFPAPDSGIVRVGYTIQFIPGT